jgi:hypothetical protein
MTRRIVLAVVLIFIVGIAFLTLYDVVRNGVTPLAVVSVGILVLLFFGIVGALTQPPRR